MPKFKISKSALPVILILLLPGGLHSSLNDKCSIQVPDDRVNCFYTCDETVLTEEEFQSWPNIMTNCQQVNYMLRGGNFTAFAPHYFSKIGNVKHFTLSIYYVAFDHFPGVPGEESPFTNLTFDTRFMLDLISVTAAKSWSWGAFDAIRPRQGAIGEVQTHYLEMNRLEKNFAQIFGGSMGVVAVIYGKLESLDDELFAEVPTLRAIILSYNQITDIKRSHFPNPANMLETMFFMSNKLTSLPIDMFLNMPSLKEVILNDNLFTTIDEVAFRPIAGRISITFSTSTLHCDCGLRWLKYVSGPYAQYLLNNKMCLSPPRLRGLSLRDVTEKQLGCHVDEIDD